MKKYISLLLAAMTLIPALAGCVSTPQDSTAATEADVTVTEPQETETVTEEETTVEITETETETETEEETEILPEVTEDIEAMKAEPAAQFKVSRAFGSGMVIQRNEYIRIWGWADASENGKRVEAELGGLHGATVITDGEWTITLGGTLKENTEGQTLRVFGAEGVEKTFEDVLVGDVYWVIGQSNVWYPVSYVKNEPLASEEARNAEISNDLQIRLNRTFAGDFGGIDLGTNAVSRDVVNRRGWQKPEQGAMDFSALGYFNALKLYNAMDRKVPIGMIEFDGNGCALHAFLPNEVRDELKVSTLSNGHYSAPGANTHVSSFMYNHGMYSFQKMPIKGIIWYQGESDLADANNNNTAYAERFTALIKYLRNAHDQIHHEYPVYIVELPPIFIAFDFAKVRLNMGTIPTMLEEAYTCTTSDLWKEKKYGYDDKGVMDPVKNNLHPFNKWEIADRMYKMILAHDKVTGDLNEVCGPQFEKAEISDDGLTVTIKYRYVGEGLKSSGHLQGFKVTTASKKTWAKPATMEITGPDTVVITAKAKIKSVAYETQRDDTFPERVNLCSSTGIPATAFTWIFE